MTFNPRTSQNCVIDEHIELGSISFMKEQYPPRDLFFGIERRKYRKRSQPCGVCYRLSLTIFRPVRLASSASLHIFESLQIAEMVSFLLRPA